MRRNPTNVLRRVVQLLFLSIFLILFVTTTYRGGNEVNYPINVFFQINPLAALGNLIAARAISPFFWPSVIVVVATLILGRFFCGWVCPLGATLDLVRPVLKEKKTKWEPSRNLKYYILFVLLVAAVFAINLTGVLDPISIMIRSLTLALYPVFSILSFGVFDGLYYLDIPVVSNISEGIYGFLAARLLPFNQGYFLLSIFSFVIFITIILAEKIRPRFWCRYLCPLGALLAILAGMSFLKRRPISLCARCEGCRDVCETSAFSKDGKFMKAECILTLSCVKRCEEDKVKYSLGMRSRRSVPNLKRRYVVSSVLAGLFIPPLLAIQPKRKLKETVGVPSLIRPPGSAPEGEFLSLCVKCSECMMVCPTGGLQPDLSTGGIEGLFSPILVPRIGYCEYYCTLCGQVCPTDAIRELTIHEKLKAVIGKAYIDPGRCIPYAYGTNCLVCEEHCPTSDKAIKFREIEGEKAPDGTQLKKPYVVYDLCVGCGICENKCPVGGRAAIVVTTMGSMTDSL